MILIIAGIDITKLKPSDYYIIALSVDGSQVMINTNIEPTNISIIDNITIEMSNSLLSQDFWKQPCINC